MPKNVRKPFGFAALLWGIVGVAVCKIFQGNTAGFFPNLSWMAGLFLLSLFDLFVLAKTVQGILFIAAQGTGNSPENRAQRVLQTFYWAILKLACLGIFVFAMVMVFRTGKPVPTAGLLAGIGTVAMVPLIGGLFWSQTGYGRAI